jgi:hypothetical protein
MGEGSPVGTAPQIRGFLGFALQRLTRRASANGNRSRAEAHHLCENSRTSIGNLLQHPVGTHSSEAGPARL